MLLIQFLLPLELIMVRTTYSQAAQQSQGIQTLLEAEKEAAKIVQKARTCKLCFPPF